MSKGFFITGTDTGVGKTIIAGAIIRALNSLGTKACGMKPVESGCRSEGGVLVPDDGMFLKHIAHMEEPLTLITPCRLASPLAPLPASEIDRIDVNITEIKKAFTELSGRYEAVVVEGVGGLLVPIRTDYYVIDLAREFGLPLIVVAKPGLGTINHLLLTVKYALKEGLEIAGVIINYSHRPENSLAEETNPGVLARICPVPVIGTFPWLKGMEQDLIEKTAVKNLDLDLIKKHIY